MTGFLWAALTIVLGLVMTAIGDLVSEEVRDRLDHLPHAILRLAAWRLDQAQRVIMYDDEWMPELTFILKGDEARPITRLYDGTRFALGILCSAHRIASQVDRAAIDQATRDAGFKKVGVIALQESAIKGNLILSGVTGLDTGDEIQFGDLDEDRQTYEVMGVANDHGWFVRRVRNWDEDGMSQP
jgi:hypothetical protein